ncbi:STAS domain-containing protein [Streptomyces niveiscabiei]|uniref:STAS domain-containing protein n=1 Tax=Streptomyces niveiscabiei TaxID=164115 RepID=UPI0029A8BDB1|nr:STAS domain-containing protein [Streptomyces niveiscabiei]MDX3387221.1 STAS domain-containing protein [Streptomyces niveiscabiei]
MSTSTRYVRVHRTRGRTVVELRGEVDIAAAVHIAPELDAATRGRTPVVVIDLAPVEFMDCYGLGLLCRARRRVEERGGHLTLVCPHPMILTMLRSVQLRHVFALAATLDDALDGPAVTD